MSEKQREIWESTIPGRVTLQVTNEKGRPLTITTRGKGQRLRIAPEDREIAEESVRQVEHNPFRNGMLVRVDKSASHSPSADELTDPELQAIFELEPADFRATVSELGEVNIRRLKAMTVEADASKSEMEFIDELIAERYPIGGSMPTYDEMQPKSNSKVTSKGR